MTTKLEAAKAILIKAQEGWNTSEDNFIAAKTLARKANVAAAKAEDITDQAWNIYVDASGLYNSVRDEER